MQLSRESPSLSQCSLCQIFMFLIQNRNDKVRKVFPVLLVPEKRAIMTQKLGYGYSIHWHSTQAISQPSPPIYPIEMNEV